MSIKAIVTKKAFYDGEIQNVGKILTIAATILPSWAKKFIENKKENQKTQTIQEVQNANVESAVNSNIPNNEKKIELGAPEISQEQTAAIETNTQANEIIVQNEQEKVIVTATANTQKDLNNELDDLINKSIELNIYPENMSNKTVEEQIEILKAEIEKVQKKDNK